MPTRITDLAESIIISTGSFVPIVDANESINSKNKKISVNDLRKYFYLNGNNSSSFTRHTPGFYYFGDNSDGSGNFSGSIATLRSRISASFSSSLDGPPVIKNFSSLFISRSVVISPPNRCRGMLIFVDGDAIISGSLRMTARGAKFTGSDASFRAINPPYLGDYWSAQLFPSSSYLSRVFAVGAAGSTAVAPTPSGLPGSTGILGRSGGGGGGGGGALSGGNGGNGSAGTSFSGGTGGGGIAAPGPVSGQSAYAFGGAGGFGPGGAGGGAGNPNGSGGTVTASGTGGLLILIVRGNLKIGPDGSISANGSAGNNLSSGGGGGGGGSGGGVLYVYYGGNLTNNGTVSSTGGNGGTGPQYNGGAGGAGTAIISKLNTAFPVAN